MNHQFKVSKTDPKRKLSQKKVNDSIHVSEEQLRAALKRKSLRDEQIEFMCELLSLERGHRYQSLCEMEGKDGFIQGKIFC